MYINHPGLRSAHGQQGDCDIRLLYELVCSSSVAQSRRDTSFNDLGVGYFSLTLDGENKAWKGRRTLKTTSTVQQTPRSFRTHVRVGAKTLHSAQLFQIGACQGSIHHREALPPPPHPRRMLSGRAAWAIDDPFAAPTELTYTNQAESDGSQAMAWAQKKGQGFACCESRCERWNLGRCPHKTTTVLKRNYIVGGTIVPTKDCSHLNRMLDSLLGQGSWRCCADDQTPLIRSSAFK